MATHIDYKLTPDTDPGPSPILWARCDVARILRDPGYGYMISDDFVNYTNTATTVANASGYPVFEGDCTMKGSGTAGGIIQLFGTTDNEEAALQIGGSAVSGGASASFVIPAASTSGKELWFEARVKKSAITNSLGGFFVGLASEGSGVADFIADAGNDFADVDLLGFWNDETDDSVGSHVHVVTQKTGAAFDTIIDTAATLVADTYVKLGFHYQPDSIDAAKRVEFFVNGTANATGVGETSGDATVYLADSTNFPGGEEMSPLIAIKMASASDMTVTMDWWRCAQLR